jgi:hypothetical protein
MSQILTQWPHLLYQAMRAGSAFVALFISLNGYAGEHSVFYIQCPPDTTVGCDAELWDLSLYGTAYIFGYGQPEPAGDPISEEYNLNSCGTGTIVRTWVAYDYGNNAFYCSQTIYVTGGGSGAISWPPDYIIHSCDPWTDPDDLPPPYDKPVVYDSDCSQIVMGYEDLVFDINPPACKKILRKWTVLDWCIYNPNDGYPVGIWEHTQVIKITPENPPLIWCPNDTVVTADGDCSGGYVSLPPATGSSDCGSDVIITNKSPYSISGGANASGHYPLGTTKIIFKASDGCGGYTTCSMYITVKDMKAPTPICYYGVTVSLMQMPDGYFMDLRPEFFNKASFDNCTPDQYLKFDIEPKRVSCENLGATAVKVFVTDLDGNTAYCNTIVVVQDNNGICPPTNGLIQGSVYTPDGSMIEEVKVTLEGYDSEDLTGSDGEYSFAAVPFGEEYTIRPERDEDDTKGITTMDLVILLKHIIGVETIDDPYLYLAADIDNSGNVSVNDLLELKDIILRNYRSLPASTSWRFIDADFVFSDLDNPMSDPIPAAYTIATFTQDMSDLNFVGVKVGDLTGDVNTPSEFGGITTRSNGFVLNALHQRQTIEEGQNFQITIASDMSDAALQAIQFSLGFDPAKAEFTGVSDMNMPGLTEDYFGLKEINDGKITAVWFDTKALTKARSFFTLNFRAIESLNADSFLELDTKTAQALAYDGDGNESQVSLNHTLNAIIPNPERVEDLFFVGNNYPNPFASETVIPVQLSEEAMIVVEVFSTSGVLLHRLQQTGVIGVNEVTVRSQDMDLDGILFARVTAGNANTTIKMLSQKSE